MTGFAAVGDAHLRPKTWKFSNVASDSYASFAQICMYCFTRKKPLVVLGDVTNVSLPDSKTVGVLSNTLNKLFNSGLRLLFIQGQHDMAKPPWLSSITDGKAEHIHGKLISDLVPGHVFSSLDCSEPHEVKSWLRELPKEVTGLFCHQLINPVVPFESSATMWAEDIPMHVKLVLAGDYHAVCEFPLPSGGTGFYTGSTYVNKADEYPFAPRSFIDVDTTGVITRVPLVTRVFRKISPSNPDAVLAAIAEYENDASSAGSLRRAFGLYPCLFVDIASKEDEHKFHELVGKGMAVGLIPQTRKTKGQIEVDSATDADTLLDLLPSVLPVGAPGHDLAARIIRGEAVEATIEGIVNV